MVFETFSPVPLYHNMTAYGCRKISRSLALSSGYKRSIVIIIKPSSLLNASLKITLNFLSAKLSPSSLTDRFSLRTTFLFADLFDIETCAKLILMCRLIKKLLLIFGCLRETREAIDNQD